MTANVLLAFDFLDPWGWIAERRLNAAMQQVPQSLTLVYQPCRTPLTRDAVGEQWRAFQRRRYGSQAHQYERRWLDAALEAGLALDRIRLDRVPDPRLAMWMLMTCPQHAPALFEALHVALYQHGRDIADPQVLLDVWETCGLAASAFPALAQEFALMGRVQAGEAVTALWCQGLVPSVCIGDKVVAGAQPAGLWVKWLGAV